MSSLRTLCVALVLGGCATAPPPPPATRTAPSYRPRPGVIESVDAVGGHRVESNLVDDVVVAIFVGGMVLGGLVLHHGPRTFIGAEPGTGLVVEPDGESSTVPRYQILVRFDDGDTATFDYRGAVPFHQGERVVLTRQGLLGA